MKLKLKATLITIAIICFLFFAALIAVNYTKTILITAAILVWFAFIWTLVYDNIKDKN